MPGGKVGIIVDGSTQNTELTINSLPHPIPKGYAHSYAYGMSGETHILNIGQITVNSGKIGAIDGFQTANLSGPLVASGTTTVNRIAFNAIEPGASIKTGGDLNTLDVLNGVTLNSGDSIDDRPRPQPAERRSEHHPLQRIGGSLVSTDIWARHLSRPREPAPGAMSCPQPAFGPARHDRPLPWRDTSRRNIISGRPRHTVHGAVGHGLSRVRPSPPDRHRDPTSCWSTAGDCVLPWPNRSSPTSCHPTRSVTAPTSSPGRLQDQQRPRLFIPLTAALVSPPPPPTPPPTSRGRRPPARRSRTPITNTAPYHGPGPGRP